MIGSKHFSTVTSECLSTKALAAKHIKQERRRVMLFILREIRSERPQPIFFLDSCNKEICGKSSNIYVTHLFPLFSGLSMMFSIAENIPRCFYSSDLHFQLFRHLAKLMLPQSFLLWITCWSQELYMKQQCKLQAYPSQYQLKQQYDPDDHPGVLYGV